MYPYQHQINGGSTPAKTRQGQARYAMGRVRRMSRRLRAQWSDVLDEDELTSCGGEAIARCLPLHDPALAPLRPYLDQRLRWAMLHACRRIRRRYIDATRGRPTVACKNYRDLIPNRVTISGLDGHHATPSILMLANAKGIGRIWPSGNTHELAMAAEPDPEQQLSHKRRAKCVREIVASLTKRHRHIVTRHYFEGASFASIARELSLSRSAICRVHRMALRCLSKRLRQAGISSWAPQS